MGVWDFLGGVKRQIDVFDNNATFKNKHGAGSASVATQAKNMGVSAAKSAVAAPWFFLKEDIINPAKEIAAQVTGNEEAQQNVNKSRFGGTESPKEALQQIAGNTALLGFDFLAPGASSITKTGAKGVATKVAVRAGGGAGGSVASTVASGDPLTKENLLKSAAYGGAAGTIFGTAGEGARSLTGGKVVLGAVEKKTKPGNAIEIPVGQSSVLRVGQEEMERLTKATSPKEVSAVFGDALPRDIVDTIAPAIARTQDPNIISNIIGREASVLDTPLSNIQAAGSRPNATIQTEIEQAHNIGDTARVAALIDRLPTEDQPAMRSAMGITQAAPTSPDAFQQISDALNGRSAAAGQAHTKGIKRVTAESAQALSEQRGKRFSASARAATTAEGSQGYFNELKQLKGKYDRPQLGGMIDDLGPDQAESLFAEARKQVLAIPDSTYEAIKLHPQAARLNTQTALRKVIFGEGSGVPTPSEIKLLEMVSPQLADDVKATIPKDRALFDFAAKVAGVPRALKSSLDFSMGGRQGLLVAARNPIEWAKANIESVKYFKNPSYFKQSMKSIADTPEYSLADKYNLALSAVKGMDEEAFASADLATGKLAKKIGVGHAVEASERAYNGGLTKLRYDIWKKTLDSYGGAAEAEQLLGKQGLTDMAEVINTLTGRGGKKGGLVEQHMKSLSTTLFSPRLWASRLNTLNPYYYSRLSPAARKVALQNAAAFAAVASVALGAAKTLGADVETDARSSDFLKVKFGDTRYDILGGLQQNLVFAWRELTGEKKNSMTGEVSKFAPGVTDVFNPDGAEVDTGIGSTNRLAIAGDIVENKLNPALSSAAKIFRGKDKAGNKLNIAAEIGQLFVPISIQGAYHGFQREGVKGVAKNTPDIVGLSTQTYGTSDIRLSEKQQAYVDQLKNRGASKERLDATRVFYQTLKQAPDRQKASGEINKALAKGDPKKARQIAQDYNQRYAATFKEWSQQYKQYVSDKTLAKEYSKGKIKLTSSSIRTRSKNIKSNPLFNATYGGTP